MEPFSLYEELSLELNTSFGKVLVLGDPHIAFELSRGLRVRTWFEKTLAEFVKSKRPDLLIVLGDVKEPIGLGTFTKKLLMEFFSELTEFRIVITKGNHDGKIEEITAKFENIKVVDYFILDNMLFLHGHQSLPKVEFKRAILGHIHPAVSVKIGNRTKKAKCFFKIGNFLILPTVNPYIEGFDVREGIKMVPFLKRSSEGEAYLPDGTYLGVIELDPKP
ncbi:metallophosphoesterase [Thermococcus argininiproducens]|uniref:Metallophosphoesterase n=1 Tax=Thermococcus argininiproducens TaxID=2866384 RepID=A0A9E7MAE8_9EURY|nr:metallophosphoesterase [Thermococcus argininiproducens]USH00286.1 metallophosphoesterase [Thermococcus argininiproducens]